ncbi:hypothetical protein H257_08662 [Aphanomyces astaci]|uniref:Uncharacterized protein n=1 Tax=Aphanomyces astaci TaxID=112090 RepID=W4GDT9_APHAT|nr:hypothetical protein H257_08662 [Aphanomyces astaci]ETV77840.1 hypothetical protein H257_08662 [Aphanomyces astaci]|eukprot:XP_009832950.1 hypothetical protein H257_08662 [Aphanomyces astaci]
MLQDARSSADCVASDDEPPTLNDVVSRRKWTSGDPRRGRQGLWMYEGLYPDGKSKWLYRGHPDECQQPRIFDVVDRYEAYVATKPGHHGHPTLSLGDFKKADVNYNRKIGARSGLSGIIFEVKGSFGDRSIDRSVYNKSCMRNRPVGKDKMAYICGILDDNGPGVYVIYTSDLSLLGLDMLRTWHHQRHGHYTNPPACTTTQTTDKSMLTNIARHRRGTNTPPREVCCGRGTTNTTGTGTGTTPIHPPARPLRQPTKACSPTSHATDEAPTLHHDKWWQNSNLERLPWQRPGMEDMVVLRTWHHHHHGHGHYTNPPACTTTQTTDKTMPASIARPTLQLQKWWYKQDF